MATHDRRASAGDRLARLLLRSEDPVPFDELAGSAPDPAEVADVAGWVGNAVDDGLVEDIPGGDGRRRFRLRRRGHVVLTQGRRAGD